MADNDAQDEVRIVIVEDKSLYRDLLRLVLSKQPRLEVVGAFAEADSALRLSPPLEPHVLILDIELPGSVNGIQLGLLVRRQLPHLGIVLLSNHVDPQLVSALQQEGMAGWSYLLKKSVSDAEALRRAIEGAAAGFVVLDPQLVSGLQPRAAGSLSRLTPRQREILGLIAQGFTNTAIARRLALAEKSVENHINLLYQQLEIDRQESSVHARVSAVLLYLKESRFQNFGKVPGSSGG